MKRFYLFLFFITLSYWSIWAQTEESAPISHLIISLDRRATKIENNWDTNQVSNEIRNLLKSNKITPSTLSANVYGVEQFAPTPEKFATPVITNQQYNESLNNVLEELRKVRKEKGTFFSTTSFAKPYSLMANKGHYNTNRTFLIIISDFDYNGNDDYYGEVKYVKNYFTNEGNLMFKEDIKQVQTNYFCQFIEESPITGGYVQLYEFIPLQAYFSLESVLDFPKTIVAKRSKTSYKCPISITNLNNPNYDIHKFTLTLWDNSTLIESVTWDITQNAETLKTFYYDFDIEKKYKSHALTVDVKTWIKLNDGVYNNTVLHPQGSDLQGAKGLSRPISIEIEKDAEILGVRLGDGLFEITFWTNDQQAAATSWGWIFIITGIILIVTILILSIRKNLINKPVGKDIKI